MELLIFKTYKQMVKWLNDRTAEYDAGKPTVDDKTWDNIYFEVQKYEYLHPDDVDPESPTRKISYTIVNELKKKKHNHPMLSLAKTKDIEELSNFIGDERYVCMAKMDGLTCSLYYEGGKLVSAETRGNGTIGEDITHNAFVIPSIPNKINYNDPLTVDGEIICTYKDFEKWSDEYKNPRNFAAGSIRLLDSNECATRNLTFIAWDCFGVKKEFLSDKLSLLQKLNFNIVPTIINQKGYHSLENTINEIKEDASSLSYPIDGVVIKIDNIEKYNSMGRTDHHFKGGIAYKFYDEEYETRLCDIEWSISRTGQISPIAVFENININGTDISKASLSNLSIMEQTLGKHPFIGQELRISKRNQIIPKIERAKDENGEWII